MKAVALPIYFCWKNDYFILSHFPAVKAVFSLTWQCPNRHYKSNYIAWKIFQNNNNKKKTHPKISKNCTYKLRLSLYRNDLTKHLNKSDFMKKN